MTVTVDHEPLAAGKLGLRTVGEVLNHLQRGDRLVVQVLVDGEEPDVSGLRQIAIAGHTIFIETADPRQLAMQVLDESARQLAEADRLKAGAAEMLQRGQLGLAMAQLGTCLRIWQSAEESITKTAELLRIDLDAVRVGEQPIPQLLAQFTGQLRQIKSALEQRDFVSVGDVLLYEMSRASEDWSACVASLRELVASLK